SYPHMNTLVHHRIEDVDVESLAKEVDFVFTATPSGIASKLAPQFIERGVKVIDISGDFRIKDRTEYETWYGMEASDEQLLNEAVYGLTEWIDEDVTDARLIANPGCFPTGILLGLLPLVKEN